jgi:hypothetical protein
MRHISECQNFLSLLLFNGSSSDGLMLTLELFCGAFSCSLKLELSFCLFQLCWGLLRGFINYYKAFIIWLLLLRIFVVIIT